MAALNQEYLQDANLMDNPPPEALRTVLPQESEARYRPRYHFTPHRNWMNDPNGLVYFAGEYHLFFQYNPFGDQWGHMSWGHAVSRDLLEWEELPVAIPETESEMIFSGCIVIDWNNVSGLGRGDEPPFLAFYTGYDATSDIQRQCLAYSHDRGRTFHFYDANPLIDLGLAHFRDPKVFYHEESAAWIMVVSFSREHQVAFYRSSNLIDWVAAGSFGPAGAIRGQWECPDLMKVPLETDPTRSKWVLKVDVDAHFVGGGSGAQYFVGDFDGKSFMIADSAGSRDGDVVDFGPDFYAAVTWSDLPAEQPGPLWIGWMSNHQTGRFYPTNPWRGAQSLPRTLFLFEEEGRLKLGQRPVSAAFHRFVNRSPDCGRTVKVEEGSASFHVRLQLDSHQLVERGLKLVSGGTTLLSITYQPGRGLLFKRMPQPGGVDESFAFETCAPYDVGEQINFDLFFDGCLTDIFVDGGRRVFSCCVFPHAAKSVSFQTPVSDGNARRRQIP